MIFFSLPLKIFSHYALRIILFLIPLCSAYGASPFGWVSTPFNTHTILLTTPSNPSAKTPFTHWNTLPYTQKSTETWSAVLVNGTQLAIGCAQGQLRPLDHSTSCGQPAGYAEDVLTWDHSRLSTPPQWKDLWNVVQLPGQRALPKSARLTLEVALLSDGVAPQHLYKTLETSQGLERAFYRLDQLRPYIVWWSTESDAQQLMHHKNFLMGMVPRSSLIRPPNVTSPAYTRETIYSLYTAHFWSIPNTAYPPNGQKALTKLNANLPHFNTQAVPISDKTLEIDNHFWTIYGPMLETRFTAWLNR